MISIHTNLSALVAQRNLKSSTDLLNQAIERMTTGFKINGAKDNAANYAIANDINTKIGAYDVAEDNTAIGLELISTASGILEEINTRIERLRVLQMSANNGTYGEDSKRAINQEAESLVDEIKRLYNNAEFNGISIFRETTELEDGRLVVLDESDAQLTTTFKELGITSTNFVIKDSSNNVVQSYDIEESDTINDFFEVLKTHGFNSKIFNGEIQISSNAGLYITGDVIDELGISTKDHTYVTSTEQNYSVGIETTSAEYSTTTIWTTTTSSTTETETVWVTNTTSKTQTHTIWETTTTSTTQTSTIYTTTTTSNTVTETIPVETTVGVSQTSSSQIKYLRNYEHEMPSLLPSATNAQIIKYNSDGSSYVEGITVSVLASYSYCEEDGGIHGPGISWGEDLYMTITPTYCSTVQDLIDLIENCGWEYLDTINLSADSCWTGSTALDGRALAIQIDAVATDGTVTNEIFKVFIDESNFTTVTVTETNTVIATTTTALSTLGITSTQYITVQNNGTETVITCNTSDTLGSVTAKLTSAGLTATLLNGTFSVTGTETIYISGMSNDLKNKLNLSGDFTSIKTTDTEVINTIYETTTSSTTVTTTIWQTTTTDRTETETIWETTTNETTQTTTIYTTTTSSTTQTSTLITTSTVEATGSTTFEELGITNSFNVTIVSDSSRSVISVNKEDSFDDLFAELESNGIDVIINGDLITFEGSGNSYIQSNVLADLLKFSTLKTNTATTKANTKSRQLSYEKILEGIYAPGNINLQVGVNNNENSRINLDIAFKLEDISELKGIGIDGVDYLNYLDELLSKVNQRLLEFGAVQNRLESVLEEITIQRENLVSSRSTLRDADIAEVSSTYIQQQILQQASATLLSTANQTPAIALQLL